MDVVKLILFVFGISGCLTEYDVQPELMTSCPPEYAFAPFDIPNTEFYFAAHRGNSWEEAANVTFAQNRVTTPGQRFGTTVDPAKAHIIRALADARRPTWQGDNLVRFAGGSSNESLVVHNSTTALSFVNNTNIVSILVRIHVITDGSQQVILDSNNGTSANRGFRLQRRADNTVQFFTTDGTQSNYNYTSTATLTNADGLTEVVLRLDGAMGGSLQIGSNPVETFSQAASVAATGSMFGDLRIGISVGSLQEINADIQDILIASRRLLDAEVQQWRDYDLATAPESFKRQIGKPDASGFPWFNMVSRAYDFTDRGTLYQDRTQRAVGVTDGDPIGTVAHVLDPANTLNRDAAAPTDAQRPLYFDDNQGAFFDGVDDQLDLIVNEPNLGGGKTWVFLVRNDDEINGSHVYSGGDRILVTGRLYAGNLSFQGVAYTTFHGQAGGFQGVNLADDDGFNIVAWAEDGGFYNGRTRGGGMETAGGESPYTEGFVWDSIGAETIAGWQLDGRLVAALAFNDVLTPSELNIVMSGLARKHVGLGFDPSLGVSLDPCDNADMAEKVALTPSELATRVGALTFTSADLSIAQATIATAVLEPRLRITEPGRIESLTIRAGVAGTAGATTVVVNKNGAPVGNSATIDNADADGTSLTVAIGEDVEEGDVVDIEVTVAPTAGSALSARVRVLKRFTI